MKIGTIFKRNLDPRFFGSSNPVYCARGVKVQLVKIQNKVCWMKIVGFSSNFLPKVQAHYSTTLDWLNDPNKYTKIDSNRIK